MAEENTILNGTDEQSTAVISDNQTVTGNPAPEQTPQPAAFDFAKMVGENGALADNWREALPENIRGEKCLDSIKTVQTLAQSYVHSQHAIGANKIAVPGENATKEEQEAFYKAIGRPDTVDDYKSDNVKLPDGIILDDAKVKEFRQFAFDHGLSQKDFEAALAFDVERVNSQLKEAQAARDQEYNETIGKLRTEFGGNFDTVVAQCNKAMQTFGLVEVLREHNLLNNYTVIKALAGIGERIGESKLKGNEAQTVANDPQSRINEIRNNPDDPYYHREHPAHNARVAEMNSLLAALAKAK